ncbi:uncharacterized protein LAESUDRAFT_711263 [Laetiporus sulphureus 93-53]|uniref:X-box-binding protein 1 n=1 Tax=Laetiporus sulphureus 93-53 TaxID=1314785 RepID=A0A165GU78_9APHY|nr:uncharacterized protein LAESUDRAFT_711263 [Laetiporus sulphureus 93-53]KZT10818.1 hypothetical protein LAESUDRAFT_711263 [Laetiporus sulphureus 93-53]
MKRTADSDLDPSSPAESSPSPAPSSSDSPVAGPPRKRSRSEITPEERKEARAHRNRIAAQNSRDRRKAQFSYLERRVAELEEENRQLRAGMGLIGLRHSEGDRTTEEQRARERTREKENEELRERIKTLETGWEAVLKALAASGLPLNSIPSAPASSSSSNTSPSSSSPSSSQPMTTAFSDLVPTSPTYPMTPTPSDPSTPQLSHNTDDDSVPTRHLARVATTDAPPGEPDFSSDFNFLQLHFGPDGPDSSSYPTSNILSGEEPPCSAMDEVVMEDLLREILAPSPTLPSASLPDSTLPNLASQLPTTGPTEALHSSLSAMSTSAAGAPSSVVTPTLEAVGWEEAQVEMQRLLDMLPNVQSDAGAETSVNAVDFPSALDLDVGGWDLAGVLDAPLGQEVGAF